MEIYMAATWPYFLALLVLGFLPAGRLWLSRGEGAVIWVGIVVGLSAPLFMIHFLVAYERFNGRYAPGESLNVLALYMSGVYQVPFGALGYWLGRWYHPFGRTDNPE
jgi:hypothetical protein